MGKTFVYSDPHFSHANIVKFTRFNGEKLRPWDDVIKMNIDMIMRYNAVVTNNDKVYFLGDVTFTSTHLHEIMPHLKGEKVLIKGNHDTLKVSAYSQYFKDIRAYHVLDGVLMAHIPVHPDSLGRWGKQVHGHLHAEIVRNENGSPDTRYFNASVERTDFAPLEWHEVLNGFKVNPPPMFVYRSRRDTVKD
jgi:calcineurin-like phosphoesterase family protein